MILAVDVHYFEGRDLARASAVLFEKWTSTDTSHVDSRDTRGLAPYEPGHFYKRELPCILPLVRGIIAIRATSREPVRTIIVDGFVDLGDEPGLGRHLFNALAAEAEANPLTVVGVAKNPFEGAAPVPVLRGKSDQPLYVTATDDVDGAVAGVKSMAGPHRIPELLRKVDLLARGSRIA